uniref:CSON007101 protein n=1 Tax=Culicoides sonorensis TaxID=179676 RepID=A0A336LXT7_CULSO
MTGDSEARNRAIWIQGSTGSSMPETAVTLRKGESHSVIYIGSVLYEGNRVLAQVHPSKKAAILHLNGKDHMMHYYKLLCAPNTSWSKCKVGSKVPSNALPVKLGTSDVYIGRCQASDSKIYLGTINPNEGMNVDFYGETVKLDDFEILVSGESQEEVANDVIEEKIDDLSNGNPIDEITNNHTTFSSNYDQIDSDNGLEDFVELEVMCQKDKNDESPFIERELPVIETEEYGNSVEIVEIDDPETIMEVKDIVETEENKLEQEETLIKFDNNPYLLESVKETEENLI